MNEEIIQRIIERLFADSEFQQLLLNQAKSKSKPTCLILLNYTRDLPNLLNQIQQRWGSNYSLSILPSGSVSASQIQLPGDLALTTPDEAFNQTQWRKIILPSCSANTLAKIALGIRDNAFTEMVACGLNLDIPVELYTEYLGFTSKTPQAYRQLYEGYLQQAESYGIRIYSSVREQEGEQSPGGIVSQVPVSKEALKQSAKTEGKVIRYNRRLLSDKDVYDFPIGSRVKVTKMTVISPLAKDSLKARKIELCLDGEGNV